MKKIFTREEILEHVGRKLTKKKDEPLTYICANCVQKLQKI
jgi:hypothetical protein